MKYVLKSLLIASLAFFCAGSIAFGQTAPEPQPIGLVPVEPAKESAKPIPVQQTILKLTPSFMLKPIGVYRMGDLFDGPYVEIMPGIELGGDFYTATNKKLSLDVGYTLAFRQYINKGHDRFIEHEITPNLSYDLSERMSVSLNGTIDIDSYNLASDQGSNEIAFELTPGMKYKLTDEIKIGLGYYILFFWDPNNIRSYNQLDSISNPPGDPSDLMGGVAGISNYSGTYSPYGVGGVTPQGEAFRFFQQGISMEVGYQFIPTTKLTFKYHYYGYTSSNKDESQFTGHQFYIVLDQNLWKGATANLQYRIRRRDFPWAFSDANNPKFDWRHRIMLTLGQTLTDYLSLESWLRIQLINSNAADPVDTEEFYLGAKLQF